MNKVKLKEICRLINGRAYKQHELLDNGKYPVLRVGNFFSDKGFYYSDMELEEDKYCDNGDLLFAWSASFGPKIWNGGKVIYHYHIWKMELTEKVDKNYLYYYLYHLSERIKSEGHGGIMIHTTKTEMEEREFVLSDLSKQREIAELLTKSASVIELRKQELGKLDELIRARFVELFQNEENGYEVYSLDEVADIVSGITKGRKTKCTKLREVPYMAVSNVKDGYIDWTTVKTIMATEDEINQYRLLPDDVLMTEGGDPDKVGRGSVIVKPPKDCIHQNHIFRVRLDKTRILPRYFAAYLQSPKAKTYFLRAAKQTTGIASINMKQLRSLSTIVPPLDKQEEYVRFSEQVDKSKVAVQKALDEAQLLFDSLMQKYFG